MEILRIKLQHELTTKLTEYANKKNYENATEIINHMISLKTKKDNLFTFSVPSYNESACQARLWDKGTQCSHSKYRDSDYCDKHQDMIRCYGVLRFGDIREKKPIHDLIKLKEGKKERLQWIHPDPMIRLQDLLDKQQKKIIYSSPTLLVT